jgi:hypothetical protein
MSAAETDVVDAPNPAIAGTERRRRKLEELSDMGMEIARTIQIEVRLESQAYGMKLNRVESPAEAKALRSSVPTVARDSAGAFARISKAIRLTLAYEARTEQDLAALIAGEPAAQDARRAERARRAAAETKTRHDADVQKVREIVREIAERESETLTEFENLTEALDERLEHDEAYAHLEDAGTDYAVRTICKDLGIDPRRHVWEGPGLPPRQPLSRPKFSVFNTPGREPKLARRTPPPNDPVQPPPANDLTPIDPAEDEIVYYDPAPSIPRDPSGFS